MPGFRVASLALAVAIVLATPAGAVGFRAAPARRPRAAELHVGHPGLRFSLPFARPGGNHLPPAGATALSRAEDWKTIGFEVGEAANALYLVVGGDVQFRVAEIVFADGQLERVPLTDVTRSDGLFALAHWHTERNILGVRLRARARSSAAHVGLVLGRDPLQHP